jgi:uncharacterized protein YdeI (BOF family)
MLVVVVAIVLCWGGPSNAAETVKKGWMGTIRGEVIKVDGDVCTIEDSLGRELRLHLDKRAERDGNIQPGDEIIARTVNRGKEVFIKSLRVMSSPSPSTSSPLIEGRVLKIEGDSYFVRDISGKDVRLHVDRTTTKDGNITIGDSVQAQVDSVQSAMHAESLNKR